MGRIKQGLDYFPLNTDFMHDLSLIHISAAAYSSCSVSS